MRGLFTCTFWTLGALLLRAAELKVDAVKGFDQYPLPVDSFNQKFALIDSMWLYGLEGEAGSRVQLGKNRTTIDRGFEPLYRLLGPIAGVDSLQRVQNLRLGKDLEGKPLLFTGLDSQRKLVLVAGTLSKVGEDVVKDQDYIADISFPVDKKSVFQEFGLVFAEENGKYKLLGVYGKQEQATAGNINSQRDLLTITYLNEPGNSYYNKMILQHSLKAAGEQAVGSQTQYNRTSVADIKGIRSMGEYPGLQLGSFADDYVLIDPKWMITTHKESSVKDKSITIKGEKFSYQFAIPNLVKFDHPAVKMGFFKRMRLKDNAYDVFLNKPLLIAGKSDDGQPAMLEFVLNEIHMDSGSRFILIPLGDPRLKPLEGKNLLEFSTAFIQLGPEDYRLVGQAFVQNGFLHISSTRQKFQDMTDKAILSESLGIAMVRKEPSKPVVKAEERKSSSLRKSVALIQGTKLNPGQDDEIGRLMAEAGINMTPKDRVRNSVLYGQGIPKPIVASKNIDNLVHDLADLVDVKAAMVAPPKQQQKKILRNATEVFDHVVTRVLVDLPAPKKNLFEKDAKTLFDDLKNLEGLSHNDFRKSVARLTFGIGKLAQELDAAGLGGKQVLGDATVDDTLKALQEAFSAAGKRREVALKDEQKQANTYVNRISAAIPALRATMSADDLSAIDAELQALYAEKEQGISLRASTLFAKGAFEDVDDVLAKYGLSAEELAEVERYQSEALDEDASIVDRKRASVRLSSLIGSRVTEDFEKQELEAQMRRIEALMNEEEMEDAGVADVKSRLSRISRRESELISGGMGEQEQKKKEQELREELANARKQLENIQKNNRKSIRQSVNLKDTLDDSLLDDLNEKLTAKEVDHPVEDDLDALFRELSAGVTEGDRVMSLTPLSSADQEMWKKMVQGEDVLPIAGASKKDIKARASARYSKAVLENLEVVKKMVKQPANIQKVERLEKDLKQLASGAAVAKTSNTGRALPVVPTKTSKFEFSGFTLAKNIIGFPAEKIAVDQMRKASVLVGAQYCLAPPTDEKELMLRFGGVTSKVISADPSTLLYRLANPKGKAGVPLGKVSSAADVLKQDLLLFAADGKVLNGKFSDVQLGADGWAVVNSKDINFASLSRQLLLNRGPVFRSTGKNNQYELLGWYEYEMKSGELALFVYSASQVADIDSKSKR